MLLLIRHLESTKNIENRFSSKIDDESLTTKGVSAGRKFAENIFEFAVKNDLTVKRIYCANSNRAIESARFIADKFNVDICSCDGLISNRSGSLLGKTEEEARNINPIFMHQLKLFRAGIFSSYDFIKITAREDKKDFEIRVNSCISEILTDKSETLKIIVLHHSSLTAAVIRFAREFYSYPSNFYGHVACALGHFYLINEQEIILCNESIDNLLKVEV